MRVGVALAILSSLVVVVAVGVAPGPARAAMSSTATPRLSVGVGRADTTPPRFSTAADASAFPNCPATVFTGPRPFAFEEPYVDQQQLGHFEYPDPYCDANANGRYDGLYLSGAVDSLARGVHDPIDARAVAFSDGHTTAVVESVVAQGLFQNVTERIRQRAQQLRPGITDLIVSADHNESSPDTIGIYGAPSTPAGVGGMSGIDDYYISFLVERAAAAAVTAYDHRRAATLSATQYRLPANVTVRLSNNFPTTDDQGQPAAIDPKAGLIQARASNGQPIVTMFNLAAHNQEVGHDIDSGLISADWPGRFEADLEQQAGGMAMFLVGDNGSEEDPQTVPPVCGGHCFDQPAATGAALAQAAAGQLGHMTPVRPGPVSINRDVFTVPLENNLFKAAAAAGLFGDRPGYVDSPAGPVPVALPRGGDALRTEVGVLTLGPDVVVMANPGESFPALMLGGPWGIDDAPCPDRPNPPVPAWAAAARWRFQLGLADDLIGYLAPAWGFTDIPGVYPTTCANDLNTDKDSKGHQHKLETESVGPTAGTLVAQHLTDLVRRVDGDAASEVRTGRFVLADGRLSGSALGAVGVRFRDGTRVNSPIFIDYDGVAQRSPDLTTRGLRLNGRRIYLNVYPAS